MAKQTINIGAAPNDGTGTPLRTSFDYTNQNFTELYNALGGGVGLPGATNQVIFNNGTNLAGDGGLIYSSATDALTAGSFNPTASAIPTNGIYLPSSKNIGIAVDGVNVLNIDGIASRVTTTGSATITGDLTVATTALKVVSASNRVLINQASAIQGDSLEVTAKSDGGAISLFGRASDNGATLSFRANGTATAKASLTANDSGLSIRTGTVERYNIDTTGVSTWSVGGSTAMTLNSTGLGVGVSPTFNIHARGTTDGRIQVEGASGYGMVFIQASSGNSAQLQLNSNGGSGRRYVVASNTSGQFLIGDETAVATRLLIDASGNVGIGVTPITSHILSAAGPLAITGTFSGTRTSYITNSSAASIYYTDGGASYPFNEFGNLVIQPRTSAARSVVIATGSTTPVERAVVKSTGQVRFVPLAADPAGAESGDVYYNSVSNKLKCYNGTTWNDLF